jgi:outer membrane pore protein E
MKTEEKLDQLFGTLRGESATVGDSEVQAWLAAVSIGTEVTSFSFVAKLKAFLATTLGKVCGGIIVGMVGMSILGILAAEPSPAERDGDFPAGASDQAIDSTVELIHPSDKTAETRTSKKSTKSANGEVHENSILPFIVQFLPLHLIDSQNEDSTVFAYLSKSPGDENQWAGVYKTYEDYLARRFYDSIPINVAKNKIYVGSFDRVVLKTDERKTSYKLGFIYGFYDGKNLRRYRVTTSQWEDYGYFTVHETNGLVLYVQVQSGYKGTQQTKFYYSVDLNAPIRSLTVKNLLTDFQNPAFTEEVKKKVDRLTNMSQEKWSVTLKEINEVYRKYFFR